MIFAQDLITYYNWVMLAYHWACSSNDLATYILGCWSCPDLFGFFSTFFKIRSYQKNQEYKVWEKNWGLGVAQRTFLPRIWYLFDFVPLDGNMLNLCYKWVICKIELLLLVFSIQKKFNTNSKTVYTYVFCLFHSEWTVVKIDHDSVLGKYNRNSIWARSIVLYLLWLAV